MIYVIGNFKQHSNHHSGPADMPSTVRELHSVVERNYEFNPKQCQEHMSTFGAEGLCFCSKYLCRTGTQWRSKKLSQVLFLSSRIWICCCQNKFQWLICKKTKYLSVLSGLLFSLFSPLFNENINEYEYMKIYIMIYDYDCTVCSLVIQIKLPALTGVPKKLIMGLSFCGTIIAVLCSHSHTIMLKSSSE